MRTSDYLAPPEKAIVGTLNNPGVRYYVKRICPTTGSVTAVVWLAIGADVFLIADTPNTTFTREEWAKLMDRWVLVKPPWRGGYSQPYTDVTIADFRTTMGIALNGTTLEPPLVQTMFGRVPIHWVDILPGPVTSSPIFEEPVQFPHGIPYSGATGAGGERPVPGEAPQGDA